MQLFKRLKFSILMAAAISLLSLPAFAATAPDPAANPLLASMLKMGTRLYYLGTHSGLDGWLILKDNKVQIAYSTPDKKGIVLGAMFGADGNSVTSEQVRTLLANNKDLDELLNAASQSQTGSPVVPPAASQSPPGVASAIPPMPSISPGERLMQAFEAASSVTVGNSKASIYMIMDPNCPHCQATWKALRSSVMGGALQIRMIPIGVKDSDNERAAAQFLRAGDPLNVWDKYVGGDKAQLAGTPAADSVNAVRANYILVDKWKIPATPYMVYRGKDGKVKIVQGELDKPEKVAALLADLGS